MSKSKLIKYDLEKFKQISFNGFDLTLPKETIDIINELSRQVGSPNYVKTPIFQKLEKSYFSVKDTKRKNTKNDTLTDYDWETIRTFQPTKIEKKIGVDAKFDEIRSYLNKLTDKNYIDLTNKIIESMEEIVRNNGEDVLRLGTAIFEIASNNRFYSKLYAELYAALINKFEIMNEVFCTNFDKFLEKFENIEHVDPNVDYDKFCKINSDNEKRKSLSAFFVNLMINKVIPEEKMIMLLTNLLTQIHAFILVDNKKNEVDELTENVAILYKKELFKNKNQNIEINGKTIPNFIDMIANSKAKDYLSITNKTIFKFMDMNDT